MGMKIKIFSLLSFIFICLTLFGCDLSNKLPEGETTFTIYSLNDFHGTLLETSSDTGASRIGKYISDEKSLSPETTLIISAGDMFQGTAVSSMSRGKAVVDVMNYIGFDAMTLGNHEFDWGIDEILTYRDGNTENGELNCPYLAANIIDKRTNELVSWAEPYTIIEKAGFKIGIIGVIGADQENDILKTYVEDYEFTDELPAISKYAEILRKDKKCDIVIVSAHNDTSSYNRQLAKLNGNCRIDLVLNGHTHYEYVEVLDSYRNNYADLPVIQSGAYGAYIGKTTITIDNQSKVTVNTTAVNLDTDVVCGESSDEIDAILSNYQEYIDKSNSILGKSGVTLYKEQGGIWAANVLRDATDSTVGVCNTGGIRSNGFPIYQNSDITYGDIFEIMPFENAVCTVYLTGEQLIRLFSYGVFLSDNVDTYNLTIYGQPIVTTKLYKVATVDYIYVKDNYPFVDGQNGVFTEYLFRDILVDDVVASVESKGKFYSN